MPFLRIDTYGQVSAPTGCEVLEVGLQQVYDAQDTATLVVFAQYVVKSVNSGGQAAPQGSECLVTPDGAGPARGRSGSGSSRSTATGRSTG